MSLGNSLIGATAVKHELALAMHNTNDFDWIEGLDVIDSVEKAEEG